MLITVTGDNLDSVQEPLMVVHLNNKHYKSVSIIIFPLMYDHLCKYHRVSPLMYDHLCKYHRIFPLM